MSDDFSSEWSERSPEDEWKNKLSIHLANITSSGSFATSGVIDDFVNPGVYSEELQDFDGLRLPISENDAKLLVSASQQAPFGVGSQTIVDTRIRKVWQLDAQKLECRNPQWQPWLDKLVVRACTELGVFEPDQVVAELYKLLLYEKGGKFDAHQDTERKEGMFATLVICLPCKHSGGDIVLEHQQTTLRINTSQRSRYSISYLAWYSDVMHTVNAVTGGHRVALTYNLIKHSLPDLQSARQLTDRTQALAGLLAEWRSLPMDSHYCLIPLDHQYTTQNLRLSALKGKDYHKAAQLVSAVSKYSAIRLLLCQIQRVIINEQDEESHGYYDRSDSEEDVGDFNVDLVGIRDMHGRKMGIKKLSVDTDCLLTDARHLYPKQRPFDEQYGGGYLGNQVAEMTQIIRDAALLLVAECDLQRFLLGTDNPTKDVSERVDYLLTQNDKTAENPGTLKRRRASNSSG